MNVLLGGLAGLLGMFAARAASGVVGDGILSAVMFVVLALLLGPFVCGFLLTVLIPAASSWSAPSGNALFWASLGLVLLISGVDRAAPLAPFVLLGSGFVWVASYAGVYLAGAAGPRRCREFEYMQPGEPLCPKRRHILYHAKAQTCPECGRRFQLTEVDLRRADRAAR